jgi:hypothetical protein
MSENLINEYSPKLAELLPLARRAYGSRDTKSPQHDASREYTRLLVEFYGKGGSLIDLASSLGVTYAGIRRRVTTFEAEPVPKKRMRSRATEQQLADAVERIKIAKLKSVEEYHESLRQEYEDNGISLTKIAKALGLSSSNPLYYGVSRTKLRKKED